MAHNELSHLGLHFALLSLKSLVSHFLELCGKELMLCNIVMSVEVQFMCWSGHDIIKLFPCVTYFVADRVSKVSNKE